jgi:O-antigen/teichoic acid export membrane protein
MPFNDKTKSRSSFLGQISKFKNKFNRESLNKPISLSIGTYGLYQLGTAVFAFIKIPLTIRSVGIAEFGILAVAMTLWAILSIPGESNRRIARVSYFQSRILPRNLGVILVDVCYVSTIGFGFAVLYSITSNEDTLPFFGALLLFSIAAILNSQLGFYHGTLEGAQKPEIANLISISGMSLGFITYLLALQTENFFIISSVQAISMILPGALIYFYLKITKFNLEFEQVTFKDMVSLRSKWSSLQFFELCSYALNGYLVLLFLGSISAAEFSIYQKVMIIASAATSALGPHYGISTNSRKEDSGSKDLKKLNFILTILGSLIILVFGSKVFEVLGDGKVVFSWIVILLVIVNALVGALTASTIQTSNSGHALSVRILSTGCTSLLTIFASILLLPHFGIGFLFLANACGSCIVFLSIRRYGARHED